MKKIIKAVVTASTLASMILIPTFSASAGTKPIITGDINEDFKVDINDVTLLQRYLAGDCELDIRQLYAADVNFNGVNDVVDATLIQEHMAGDYEFKIEQTWFHRVYSKNLCANYDSGKAMVGVPVTFTGTADGGIEPFTYEFSIGKEVVQERSSSNTFTYTFDKSGDYYVYVKCYNTFNEYSEEWIKYTVVDPYESETPVICGIHTDNSHLDELDRSVTITANTIFGTAPYEYKFTLDNGTLIQDYSENNEFYINMRSTVPVDFGDHTVLVEVKDADGNTASETFTFTVDYANLT